MCDTIVAQPSATADGAMLLAKNADTEVNEAQQILRLDACDHPVGSVVRVTHLVIPQVRHTHEVLLDRSFWAWGGEIGCNEHGVAIGNEAAFSNQEPDRDGVVALDLLRLALERAADAAEAVRVIGEQIERYGQGGNVQMMGNFQFDSGLLVADRQHAYVVNCAGRHWAARHAHPTEAISNRYQITDDWEISSLPQAPEKTDFRSHFADPSREHEVAAEEREGCASALLANKHGRITIHDMAGALRDLGDDASYDVTRDERPVHVCMHAGPYPARFWNATGAMISEVHPDSEIVWMTATLATDLSIFKPLFFGIPLPQAGFLPLGTDTDGTLWWRHERLHRRAMARYRAVKPDIRAEFDALEREFHRESAAVRTASPGLKAAFVGWCWHTARFHTERWIAALERHPYVIDHGAYRAMWDRFNAEGALAL